MGLPEGCVVLWVWLALEFNLDQTEARCGIPFRFVSSSSLAIEEALNGNRAVWVRW